MSTILSPYERQILAEFAGLLPASLGGAAMNVAVETLKSHRFIDGTGRITFAGRQALRDLGVDCPEPGERKALTFKDFSALNLKRCEDADGFNHAINSWSLGDWMTAMTGEVGEAANIIKKMNRHRDNVTNPGDPSMVELREMLKAELADIDIYLDLMFSRLGFDREAAIREKFNATSEKIGAPHRL